MEARSQKLARVSRLRSRLPYMTHVAFVALLTAATEEPLPDVRRRADIRDARETITSMETPYGKVHIRLEVPRMVGNPIGIEVCLPWTFFYYIAGVSASFVGLLWLVIG